MRYPINWNDESQIRKLFSYQTRIGLAPKFGSRPIGWYQQAQCAVYDQIMYVAKCYGQIEGNFGFKVRGKRDKVILGTAVINKSFIIEQAEKRY